MTDEFHDPLPPGVSCTQAWHVEFEDWFTRYTNLCKEGYWCRPATHIFIAWLAGRASRAREQDTPVDDIISTSADAQQFMRDFNFGEQHDPNHRPRT